MQSLVVLQPTERRKNQAKLLRSRRCVAMFALSARERVPRDRETLRRIHLQEHDHGCCQKDRQKNRSQEGRRPKGST